MTDSTKASTTSVGCRRWMGSELFCQLCCKRDLCCCTSTSSNEAATWFGDIDKVNGRMIDMNASFFLEASYRTLAIKLLLMGFVAGSYVYLWVIYPYPYWFMAYLSYWTMFYAAVYLGLSFVTSLPIHSQSQRRQGFLIKATWIMYLVAAVHGIMVVILFWATEYNPSKTIRYSTVAAHGVSFAMVVLDGAWINKVPVRLCHCIFPFLMGCLFVSWSLIQGLVPIDNPNKNEGTDESLYSILNWEEKPVASAIVSVIVLFGTFPCFTLLFWGLSLWNRRYVEESSKTTTKDENTMSEDAKAAPISLEEEETTDVEGQELPKPNRNSIPEVEQP